MTNTWQFIEHLTFGILGAVAAVVLLITGHVDSATGVAILLGALGISSTSAMAGRAITAAYAAPAPVVSTTDTGASTVAGPAVAASPGPVVARAANVPQST